MTPHSDVVAQLTRRKVDGEWGDSTLRINQPGCSFGLVVFNKVSTITHAGSEAIVVLKGSPFVVHAQTVASGEEGFRKSGLAEPVDLLETSGQPDLEKGNKKLRIYWKI